MVPNSYFFAILVTLLGSNYVKCAEFVPVYMWGTSKMSEHVPALHKISEDSFKDTLLEYLKKDPYVIVFAEHTLSPEDFAQRDQNGEIAFPNISNLKKSQTHVTYKPYVQNPIGALKQLGRPVTELSIGSLLNSPNVPKSNILVIDLNDAKDDEPRVHMLKRHDSDVISIYKDILEQHENVLAIYTAHHTSWVAPEEVTHKKSRNILEDGDTPAPALFYAEEVFMYLSDTGIVNIPGSGNATITQDTFTPSIDNDVFTLTSKGGDIEKIEFGLSTSSGYWYIKSLTAHPADKTKKSFNVSISDVYAPLKFSYHCGNWKLTSGAASVVLPGFQFQRYDNTTQQNATNVRFGDAYDCVGFTSVPIWSSLFVTAILLIIMTFGLTMMMDIRTMDRFDDAKGKTITINASE